MPFFIPFCLLNLIPLQFWLKITESIWISVTAHFILINLSKLYPNLGWFPLFGRRGVLPFNFTSFRLTRNHLLCRPILYYSVKFVTVPSSFWQSCPFSDSFVWFRTLQPLSDGTVWLSVASCLRRVPSILGLYCLISNCSVSLEHFHLIRTISSGCGQLCSLLHGFVLYFLSLLTLPLSPSLLLFSSFQLNVVVIYSQPTAVRLAKGDNEML